MEQTTSTGIGAGTAPPGWTQGYGGKPQHPMYTTSSNNYGAKAPSVHTVPTQFYAKSQQFSQHLGQCGMYRNYSLNTEVDKSKV
ncbi:piercer of microtubule wall 1 protein-like [Babylonia areolata]|uniref:piercer of microtubule wall 1 protein-like n=1 Tax=Babylonia areolata TaxID=304850 RepID=UPI003FD54EAC